MYEKTKQTKVCKCQRDVWIMSATLPSAGVWQNQILSNNFNRNKIVKNWIRASCAFKRCLKPGSHSSDLVRVRPSPQNLYKDTLAVDNVNILFWVMIFLQTLQLVSSCGCEGLNKFYIVFFLLYLTLYFETKLFKRNLYWLVGNKYAKLHQDTEQYIQTGLNVYKYSKSLF